VINTDLHRRCALVRPIRHFNVDDEHSGMSVLTGSRPIALLLGSRSADMSEMYVCEFEDPRGVQYERS